MSFWLGLLIGAFLREIIRFIRTLIGRRDVVLVISDERKRMFMEEDERRPH